MADPAVPPTTHAAARRLRQMVTCRKISGGTGGAGGTATKMTLATRCGSWRAQGRHPLHACRRLLVALQP